MFDFDEMKKLDDDENISVGGDEDLDEISPTKPQKEGEETEDWGLEEDLGEEGNM